MRKLLLLGFLSVPLCAAAYTPEYSKQVNGDTKRTLTLYNSGEEDMVISCYVAYQSYPDTAYNCWGGPYDENNELYLPAGFTGTYYIPDDERMPENGDFGFHVKKIIDPETKEVLAGGENKGFCTWYSNQDYLHELSIETYPNGRKVFSCHQKVILD